MKLPDGVTVHAGGRVYKGEIPDDKVPAKLNKTKLNKRVKEQEAANKKAEEAEKTAATGSGKKAE